MKVLYFTADFGDDNRQFAKDNGLTIRNAKAYVVIDTLEQCDAVYGDAPQAYLDKYPMHTLGKQVEPTQPQNEPEQAEKPTRKAKAE